jgi:hypothetical protein
MNFSGTDQKLSERFPDREANLKRFSGSIYCTRVVQKLLVPTLTVELIGIQLFGDSFCFAVLFTVRGSFANCHDRFRSEVVQ